MSEDGE
jgi:hypothetical protein